MWKAENDLILSSLKIIILSTGSTNACLATCLTSGMNFCKTIFFFLVLGRGKPNRSVFDRKPIRDRIYHIFDIYTVYIFSFMRSNFIGKSLHCCYSPRRLVCHEVCANVGTTRWIAAGGGCGGGPVVEQRSLVCSSRNGEICRT